MVSDFYQVKAHDCREKKTKRNLLTLCKLDSNGLKHNPLICDALYKQSLTPSGSGASLRMGNLRKDK